MPKQHTAWWNIHLTFSWPFTWTVSRDFLLQVFHLSSSPKPLKLTSGSFRIFSKIHVAPPVSTTLVGKFATSVHETALLGYSGVRENWFMKKFWIRKSRGTAPFSHGKESSACLDFSIELLGWKNYNFGLENKNLSIKVRMCLLNSVVCLGKRNYKAYIWSLRKIMYINKKCYKKPYFDDIVSMTLCRYLKTIIDFKWQKQGSLSCFRPLRGWGLYRFVRKSQRE